MHELEELAQFYTPEALEQWAHKMRKEVYYHFAQTITWHGAKNGGRAAGFEVAAHLFTLSVDTSFFYRAEYGLIPETPKEFARGVRLTPSERERFDAWLGEPVPMAVLGQGMAQGYSKAQRKCSDLVARKFWDLNLPLEVGPIKPHGKGTV